MSRYKHRFFEVIPSPIPPSVRLRLRKFMPSLLKLCRAHAREYIDALKHCRQISNDHTLPLRGYFSDAPLGLKKEKNVNHTMAGLRRGE